MQTAPTHEIAEKLKNKFFTDPDWSHVENLILTYINPLKEINEINMNQSGADVKGELKARKKLYEQMIKFLDDVKIVSRKQLQENDNKFR